MSGTNIASNVLVWNEQTKLFANALDRASTAVGVGSLIPLWNLRGGVGNRLWVFGASAYIFIFAAFVLHMLARRCSEAYDDRYRDRLHSIRFPGLIGSPRLGSREGP
jgi:hypothetical protein